MKFLWCILILFTPVQAAELVGKVIDVETKKPLQGVTVRLLDQAVTQTDTAGIFQFLDLSSQTYRLHISHVGYKPVLRELNLDSLFVTQTIALAPKVFLLDELSVTAEPVGINDVHQNPSFVTVIPRTHFEGREVSLPDVLSEATGVQVKRLGGLGAFSTLSLRGSSAEQVEVYLDGVLLNAALGGGVDLSNLPLAHVGQIEVYRGAGAAGNGLGGTVHIRTRETKKKFSQSVRGSWGSFDTRSLNGMVTGSFGQTQFLFATDYMASDNNFGFLDDNGTEYNVNDDVFASRQNNAYESVNVLGKWQKKWDNGRHLTLQESLFWKSQGVPGISNNQSQNAHFNAFRSLTELVFEAGEIFPYLSMRHTFHFTHVGESFVDANGEIGIGRRDNYYRTRTLGWQARLQVLSQQAFTTTLGVLRESYKPTARLQSSASLFDSQRWTLSGRVGMDWSLPADVGVWSLSADVRHLRSSFTGANPFAFSPLAPDSSNTRNLLGVRSGLRVNVTDRWMAKANVGRSLRAPSFYELFGDRGGVVGNVNLKPERGFTWDVGLRYAKAGAMLEAAFFDHRYRDLIQFVHTSQATSRPVNIGQARVWGAELTAQKTIGENLSLSGNYTYQRALDQSDIPHLRGNMLPNRPTHTLFFRIQIGHRWMTVFYDYTFEDGNFLDQANRRPLASRHIHNVGGKVDVREGIGLGIEVKNVNNAQIADTWGYPLPGRAFFVNVQEHF